MKKIIALSLVAVLVIMAGCAPTTTEKTDWEYVKDNGALIVGLDDTFAPMGFRDTDGNLVGFDIDLATAVGEYLGIEITFQPIDWDAKEMELSEKKIDCIWNGMSATPEREENMSLSKKYLNNKIVIMVNEGVKIEKIEDLKDLKIGTQAESAALEAMQNSPKFDSFKDNISEYKTYDEVILDMQTKRLDCMVVDEVLGEYKNSKLEKPYEVSEVNFGDDFYAIGFRKADTELTNKVNEAIEALISNGKAEEISQKWFGKNIVIFE